MSFAPTRASAVRFELPPPHGLEVVIPAPSLQQAADCLRLDPREDALPESDRERIIRLQRQADILLGPEHKSLTTLLTIGQVSEVMQALYLAALGIDPTNFVQYQQDLRDEREEGRSAQELLREIETLTVELAAELRITPAQAAQMPVADALSLRKKLADSARHAARFEAALHDKELK